MSGSHDLALKNEANTLIIDFVAGLIHCSECPRDLQIIINTQIIIDLKIII